MWSIKDNQIELIFDSFYPGILEDRVFFFIVIFFLGNLFVPCAVLILRIVAEYLEFNQGVI